MVETRFGMLLRRATCPRVALKARARAGT